MCFFYSLPSSSRYKLYFSISIHDSSPLPCVYAVLYNNTHLYVYCHNNTFHLWCNLLKGWAKGWPKWMETTQVLKMSKFLIVPVQEILCIRSLCLFSFIFNWVLDLLCFFENKGNGNFQLMKHTWKCGDKSCFSQNYMLK